MYDRLESPILWMEEDDGRSESGRARIPAEHVRSIFEVKSALNRQSLDDATAKLSSLGPLVDGVDDASERYPRFLPPTTLLGMVFLELRSSEKAARSLLEHFRDLEFGRPFYGGVILRGEGLSPDATGHIQQTRSEEAIEGLWLANGLLHHIALTGTVARGDSYLGAMINWSALEFSNFAFDLLAFLQGTYQAGRASSFHGLDFSSVDAATPPAAALDASGATEPPEQRQ